MNTAIDSKAIDLQFIDRCYGKNYVRLLYVRRDGIIHHVKEIEVNIALTLNDARDFLHGDNSKIVATDSQKNTVYILAKKYGIKTIEEFSKVLSQHFLEKYDHIMKTRIYIEEKPWARIQQGGVPHNHAFIAAGDAVRVCYLQQAKHGVASLFGGLKDMKVMKTTQSAFKNFISDEYRSLPDMDDRVFCTIVEAKWQYDSKTVMDTSSRYDDYWECVKNSVLDVFAGPTERGIYSPSVQKTLYDTAKHILNKIPEIKNIEMELPNVHAYEYDFSKYPALGLKNEGQVFQPTDKPSGNIKASLQRRIKANL